MEGQGLWALLETGRGTGHFLPQSSPEEPAPELLDFRLLVSHTGSGGCCCAPGRSSVPPSLPPKPHLTPGGAPWWPGVPSASPQAEGGRPRGQDGSLGTEGANCSLAHSKGERTASPRHVCEWEGLPVRQKGGQFTKGQQTFFLS